MNPYEVENVADTLNRALEMPLDERQLRMNQLKKRERRMNVESWVNSFLETMGGIYDEKVNLNIFLEIQKLNSIFLRRMIVTTPSSILTN